jgi:hypothetical protein
MARPDFDFNFNPIDDSFELTFSNEHITIAAEGTIDLPPPDLSIAVEDLTLTFDNPSPHDTFTLPVHDFVLPVVPPPLEDLLNI